MMAVPEAVLACSWQVSPASGADRVGRQAPAHAVREESTDISMQIDDGASREGGAR